MSRERRYSLKRFGTLLFALVGLTLSQGWARADSFVFLTPNGSTDSKGDPVDAKAVFTTSNGSLHVELTNLLVNQKDVGQNISDISWHVASGLSSGSVTSSSGLERTVAKGGTFKDGKVVSTGWKLTPGSTWELTGLDGAADTPAHTILGSPSGSKYSNANGSTGSFQTSKGSAGAGFSGANGNSGFVAKDANNNNVYAGADGNVYKKDSNGDWSKWNNGSWTPVDPTTAEAQAKTNAQNKKAGTQGSSNDLGSTAGRNSSSNRPDGSGRDQRGSGQNTPTQPPSRSLGSSDTMGQLQNDAGSRERGDKLERNNNRGGGLGSAHASGGGANRRRP